MFASIINLCEIFKYVKNLTKDVGNSLINFEIGIVCDIMKHMRLDLFLAKKNFFPSREKAKQAVESGRVFVDGKLVTKPSFECSGNEKIEANPFEFVSRGGFKLQKAIEEFGIDLQGRVVLDIGASTGGFTDVCLQNGANHVFAVDTGEGQLAEKLLKDKRVTNLEKTNFLTLSKNNFAGADFVCIDVSFVSLTKFAKKLSEDFLGKNVEIVALIKPQFEVGADYARKHKGIVKDEKMHQKVIEIVLAEFEKHNFRKCGLIPSPIKGGDGNIEFLLWLKK